MQSRVHMMCSLTFFYIRIVKFARWPALCVPDDLMRSDGIAPPAQFGEVVTSQIFER